MTDIITKIRRLLAGDSAKKRKASDEDSSFHILKRFREASTFTDRTSKFDLPSEATFRYEQLNKGRRYTDFAGVSSVPMKNSFTKNYSSSNHMLNHESTPPHSSRESWNNHEFQSHLSNGGSHFNENVFETDQMYQTPRPQLPPLQPIRTGFAENQQRQMPSLIKANAMNSQRKANDSMSFFNRQTLSNVPKLYRVHRPDANYFQPTSSTQQSRPSHSSAAAIYCQQNHVNNYQEQPAFRNLSAAKNYCVNNSLSLKQNLDVQLKENGLHGMKTTAPDKKSYRKLIDLFPTIVNKSTKSKGNNVRETSPQPQAIIDLANENEDYRESQGSYTPLVEPVNTLRTRMETKPLYDDNWVVKLNEQYSTISQNRSETVRAEKERSSAAERATRELEGSFLDRMKSLDIDRIYDFSEEQEEVYNDFPALNDQQLQKIYQWFNGRDTSTILNSKFNLSITRHDIQTLSWDPLAWLNDEVINFYMELLGERSRNNDSLPNVHGMNTFFLKRLMEAGYAGVRRWTRKVDIFAQEIIPVPVHKGIHWCMAIIHMKNKTIKYYDSMGAPNNVVLNALADYLQAESLDKKKQSLDMSDWTKENVPNIPQQENGSDCGVFSCMYAEFVTRNRPITFTQQHMQYFRKRMIYEICTGQMIV